jgi:transcriptional regulator with XRE-family HTH domain
MPFSPSRLRGHREGQRFEIHQLAEISGLAPGRIEEIERGQSTPPTDYESKCLLQALDLEPSELRAQRPTPWGDYCNAVLTYAPASRGDRECGVGEPPDPSPAARGAAAEGAA